MTVEKSQQDGGKSEPQLCLASDHDARSRTKYPLLQLKTPWGELTLGRSWIGVVALLANADYSLAGALLGLLSVAGIVLLGSWVFVELHRRS